MTLKTAESDGAPLFIDDGGPSAYSTYYKNLTGSVARSFLEARLQARQQTKTAVAAPVRPTGIVRCPQRRRDEAFSKEGTVAGGPNTSELEKAFAQIAETYVTDKAPLLTNYMLGFQLLKKTSDDTKVCGIFAYKVGDELVYIPVFSINGDIQGHELMYVVSRDQFVPSDEKWVNYLLSRKPLEPGRVERRDRSQIPTQGTLRPTYMSSGLKLSSYTSLPVLDPMIVLDALRTMFKQASVGTPLLERSFWRDVALTHEQRIPALSWKTASAIDLDVRTLFGLSLKAVKLADRWSRDYPVFARLLNDVTDGEGLDHYKADWEKRGAVARRLGVRAFAPKTLRQHFSNPTQRTTKVAQVHVSVCDVENIPEHRFRFMSNDLIDRIHRDGYDVTDTRDQTKLASLVVDGSDRGLANPVGPGLYKVFMADGSFRDCFVLYRDHPTSRDGEPRWIVLDKETKKKQEAALGEIWTATRDDDPNWLDKLPPGNGHVNEKEEHEYERHKGITSYLITPSGHAWEGRFLEEGDGAYYDEYDSVPISLTSITLKGFRAISQADRHTSRHPPVIGPKETILRRYKDEESGRYLALGSRSLWLAMLLEGTLPVTIRKQQKAFAEYAIDGETPRTKSAALERLMVKHDLSRETAEELIKLADAAGPRGVTRIREKTAFSGQVPTDRFSVLFPQKDRGQHGVTGLAIEQDLDTEEPIEALRPTKVPDEKEMWPGLTDAETNTSGGPPAPNQADMNLAAQASASGQKDFVSSQMLLSLLREIDNDDIIAKYVSTFEKACDTLGRLYMQLLWRTDAFEERFGRTQLKEFKEMLVALFLQMGDFICYLRQRDIRPSPVLSLGTTNIDENT